MKELCIYIYIYIYIHKWKTGNKSNNRKIYSYQKPLGVHDFFIE